MSDVLKILFMFFLVFANGFFVAAEFAMVKVRESRIETLMLEGNRTAKYVYRIITDLNSYLSACQLGITLTSLGLGWIGEPALFHLISPVLEILHVPTGFIHAASYAVAFSIVTTLHIVLGELVPKSLAILNAEQIAMFTAVPMIVFYKTMYPIIWVFNATTNGVLKVFGIDSASEGDIAHTDQEIKILIEDSYQQGLIDNTERAFVNNIFDFSETTVREIMTPRMEMVCIDIDADIEETLKMLLKEQMTRYPVYKGDKDHIVGFIHIKDLYTQKLQGDTLDLNKIMREVLLIPKSLSISTVLKKFQEQKMQMAIAIDEYGGTAGLITVEDILEEIVGEIQDEFDNEANKIEKIDDEHYSVEGKMLIEEINDLFDLDIDNENYDTIAGWIAPQLKSYPDIHLNEKVTYKNFEFIITKCDKQRILRILIKKIKE